MAPPEDTVSPAFGQVAPEEIQSLQQQPGLRNGEDHSAFAGFPPQTPEFLHDLAANNRKVWFEEHRNEYMNFLRNPLQRLAAALAGPLLAIDPDPVNLPMKTPSRGRCRE